MSMKIVDGSGEPEPGSEILLPKHWWDQWSEARDAWTSLSKLAVSPATKLERLGDLFRAMNAMFAQQGVKGQTISVSLPMELDRVPALDLAMLVPSVLLSAVNDVWAGVVQLRAVLGRGGDAWAQLEGSLAMVTRLLWTMAVYERITTPPVDPPAAPGAA